MVVKLSLQVLRRYILREHLVALFVFVFELLWDFHAIVGGEFCFLVEEFAFDVKDFIVLSLAKLAQSIFLSWLFHYSKRVCSHSYPCNDSEHNGIEIDAPRNNAFNHHATASNYEEKDVLQFVASA